MTASKVGINKEAALRKRGPAWHSQSLKSLVYKSAANAKQRLSVTMLVEERRQKPTAAAHKQTPARSLVTLRRLVVPPASCVTHYELEAPPLELKASCEGAERQLLVGLGVFFSILARV